MNLQSHIGDVVQLTKVSCFACGALHFMNAKLRLIKIQM